MPAWIDRALWWHVYPLGFLGAETQALPPDAPVAHRLPALIPWLDYAAELGATGLALGPIFASETHGYDTTDHLRIDPRLGDDADFDALVEALKSRGLKLMLDGVFNHVGRGFPAFARVLAQGPEAPEAAWFRLRWPHGKQAEPDYDCFEGHRQLVTLNHDAPPVVEYVAGAMCHWLDRGADAWRLDAAYAAPRAFWAKTLAKLRQRHPDAYVMGEVIHGDYAGFVTETGADSVTQYELWKAIWSALNDRNFFELAHALQRHDDFLKTFAPYTFVGNHDVTRLASRLNDRRHLPHALAVMLTIGGTPSVYAGDEQGFEGIKEDRIGGDDAVRPAFPPSPAGLPPEGAPVFDLHKSLIALRQAHPWLHRARTQVHQLSNEALVFEATAEGASLLTALNLADQPATLPAPQAASVALGEAQLANGQVTLPPHGWAILTP